MKTGKVLENVKAEVKPDFVRCWGARVRKIQ
jgi:hypothetical protein